MRNHLGTSFKVWNRRHSWFWLVMSQHGNGGAIGTATSEADAVSEACSSIEEMIANHSPVSASSSPAHEMPGFNHVYQCEAAVRWLDWWMSITHQLTDKMLTRWADLVLRSS